MNSPAKPQRFTIPKFSSPGCALVPIAMFLLLIGTLLLCVAVASLFATHGDPLLAAFLLVFGVLFVALALGALREAFSVSSKIQLFEADVVESPQLTSRERRILEAVKSDIGKAPSQDQVLAILRQHETTNFALANPALQPISFALKPRTQTLLAKGIFLEIATWVRLIVSTPIILLLGVAGFAFAWQAGKTVIRDAIVRSRNARRYRIRTYRVLITDQRFPILYLRAFTEDYGERLEGFFPETAEERLAHEYYQYGPVIAIGEPDEEIPFLGASRVYFDDSTWQAGVLYLMSISRVVIIHAGFASGLLWELGMARLRVQPGRLIISFAAWADLTPMARHLNYLRYKKFASEILDCNLPEHINNTDRISFDDDWRAKEHHRRHR